MNTKTFQGLNRQDGSVINNLNTGWTSKPYSLAEALHIATHLFWDAAIEGTLYLEFSCDPKGDGTDVNGWVTANTVLIPNTERELMILDSNLAVPLFRLRFEHSSGTANLTSFVTTKG